MQHPAAAKIMLVYSHGESKEQNGSATASEHFEGTRRMKASMLLRWGSGTGRIMNPQTDVVSQSYSQREEIIIRKANNVHLIYWSQLKTK